MSPFNFDVAHSATEPFAVANGSQLSTYPKALTNYASDEDECPDPLATANGSVNCFSSQLLPLVGLQVQIQETFFLHKNFIEKKAASSSM